MLSSLAPARRRLVVAAGVVVALLALAVAGLLIARSRTPTATPVAQSRPGPILVVPGYGGSAAEVAPLVTRLRALGRPVEQVDLPGRALGDLDAQARVLGAAATAAAAASHATSVDVVGFSAGGVVARLWVRDHGGASLARRVVSLGSPQHGTELAALGQLIGGSSDSGGTGGPCPIACQQLSPTSPLLAALNAGDETPAGPEFVSIWTTHDDVVLPPESARLAGALNFTVQSLCPASVVRHGGLPADPAVGAMVAAELGAGPVTSQPSLGGRC